MTNAPKTRVVDAFTGVVAGEPDTEAADLDHLRHVNGELNCRVQELETEVAELKRGSPGVVARAKAALEGVTEGPWEAQGWTSHANGERGCGILAGVGMKQRGIAWTGLHHWNPELEAQADAEFIAAARTLVPELIAEIAHLTALAAARSDQNRSDGLRAADKARKEKGLGR